MDLNVLITRGKYIYAQIVPLSIVFGCFISELYLNKGGNYGNNINNVGHDHTEDKKVFSKHLSDPINCTNSHLFQIKLHPTKVYLMPQTSLGLKPSISSGTSKEEGEDVKIKSSQGNIMALHYWCKQICITKIMQIHYNNLEYQKYCSNISQNSVTQTYN